MTPTYTTTIVQDNQVNATGIPVPTEEIEAFNSGKRPRVIASLAGETCQGEAGLEGKTARFDRRLIKNPIVNKAAGNMGEIKIIRII